MKEDCSALLLLISAMGGYFWLIADVPDAEPWEDHMVSDVQTAEHHPLYKSSFLSLANLHTFLYHF